MRADIGRWNACATSAGDSLRVERDRDGREARGWRTVHLLGAPAARRVRIPAKVKRYAAVPGWLLSSRFKLPQGTSHSRHTATP